MYGFGTHLLISDYTLEGYFRRTDFPLRLFLLVFYFLEDCAKYAPCTSNINQPFRY